MANLFSRIKDTISADIHGMLDEKEEQNPIVKLNQYLRESEKETEKVRKLVERQYRLKEEFTREYHQAKEMADKRKKQSDVAQKAGEESMYQFAIQEYEEYQARADRMDQMRQQASEQLESLEQKYEEMKHRLKDMRLKRMELMGRENIARAHNRINHVMDQSAENPYSKFSELDQYMQNIEHKVNSAYYRNTFDSKIEQLEKRMKEQESVASK
ncbi:PspA/IM30 family protein [Pontibacillus marinus]|uniref:Modulator protein n=1 Tax=Pontibacillus marinus BH030004 = DSM 16465 TaxID=1385511 RepID=A0A0A5G3C0_9BACI|nr:PspA/IM30 family protein [Pontibacillus marinus]KGX87611.1 modulator protein [Pontibacillus marinus BH030004 = DSM 16465]